MAKEKKNLEVSTKQTTTSHLKSLIKNRPLHIPMGIQALTWDKYKIAAMLNVIPPPFPLLTFVYICDLK